MTSTWIHCSARLWYHVLHRRFPCPGFFEFPDLFIQVLIITEDTNWTNIRPRRVSVFHTLTLLPSACCFPASKRILLSPFYGTCADIQKDLFLIGHKDKVTVIFVRICDGFVIGNHSGFAAPFFDGKVFLYLCLR